MLCVLLWILSSVLMYVHSRDEEDLNHKMLFPKFK